MTVNNRQISPQVYARIGGVIYLLIIILGGIDEAFIRSRLIVPGDVMTTTHNIIASKALFRRSIVGDLIMQVCDIPSIVIFYVLLKPVSKSLSLLAAFFNLVQTAILGLNKIYLLTTLSFLEGADYLKVFDPHQRQALAYLSLDLHESGYGIGLLFFGFTCIITGYLMFRSGYFPRFVGVLQVIAGLSYITNSIAQILSPAVAAEIFPILMVLAFIGELTTCLWLLVKGLNVQKWNGYLPLLCCLLLPALTTPATAQSTMSAGTQLSPPEKQAIAYIKTHLDSAKQLLVESVNINSGTLNIEGVKKVGALYAARLEKLGFTIEWVNEPDSLHRAGHLVATHLARPAGTSKKGKKLFLIGHLDTVFEPDMPAGPFTMLNDSTATGQGVNDMKGGDVVMITALEALQAAGQLKDMNVIAYFTGDEERSGTPHAVARGDFIERARTCDIALGFESATGLHQVAASRRGASGWTLDITAKTGHSAMVFRDNFGDGAIYEAARILNAFREQLGSEQYLTFNPGFIIGGSEIKVDAQDARGEVVGKTNIISPAAHVTGDLRFLTEAQKLAARQKMQDIVAASLPGTHSVISFRDGLPAMEPTPGNLQLVQMTDRVTKDIGLGETTACDPGIRGAGDISDIAQYLDCLDGLGAPGEGAHKAGETIDLKGFPLMIQRAAVLMYRLAR